MSVIRVIVYSTSSPSLEFLDLPVPKISLIFGHDVNGPGDLDLSTSKCHGVSTCQISASYALPFSTYGQAWDRQTDGQTTAINRCHALA